MANPLSWVFRLFDGVVGPSRNMSKALLDQAIATKKAQIEVPRLQKELDKLNKEGRRFRFEWGNAFKSFGGLRREEGGKWAFNLAEGAQLATNIVGGLARGVVGLLEVIGKASSTRSDFRFLLGKQEGDALLGYLDRVQRQTAFTRTQLQGMVLPLLEQGFRLTEIAQLLPAGLDVGRGSEQRVARALDLFAKVKSTGRIEGEAFKAIGLDAVDVYARIGKQLGTNAKGAKQAIEQGAIKPAVLLGAIMQSITARTGGSLGTGAVEASQRIPALLNKLRGFPEDLIGRLLGRPAVVASIENILKRILGWAEGLADRLAANPQFIDDLVSGLTRALGVAKDLAETVVFFSTRLGLIEEDRDPNIRRGGVPAPGAELSLAARIDRMLGRGPFVQAHDFLWRAGRMIQIDPADTVVGAKGERGSAMARTFAGAGTAASSVGGGAALGGGLVWSGDLVIQVPSDRAGTVQELARFSREEADAFLHSIFDRFAAETGTS